ncbi:MAG: hypothetical protein O9341_10765 [Paucibacter sp.]|nr:hypothetical protein [Roseateles sp.]
MRQVSQLSRLSRASMLAQRLSGLLAQLGFPALQLAALAQMDLQLAREIGQLRSTWPPCRGRRAAA